MNKPVTLFSRTAVVALIGAGLCLGVSAQAAEKKDDVLTRPLPDVAVLRYASELGYAPLPASVVRLEMARETTCSA